MSHLSAVMAMTPAMNWQSAAAGAQGFVAPGFEPVAEEFARNFTERGDVGAAFAVTHLGRPVLDLWGGEVAPGRRWTADSLLGVFSGTKGLLAGVMLKLIERGLLDLDQPVARYWPAFGAAGKEAIKVRHLVSHRSGVPGVRAPLLPADLSDAERIENLLAAQPTFDDPDAFLCYHALAIGWLCGGLVRAIDGRSLGRFFADEIAAPLGLETWIGLPETEEHRVGRFVFGDGMGGRWDAGLTEAQRADPVRRAVWANPPLFGDINHWDTRAFHAAEIGGAGGITTARAMAATMVAWPRAVRSMASPFSPPTPSRWGAASCRALPIRSSARRSPSASAGTCRPASIGSDRQPTPLAIPAPVAQSMAPGRHSGSASPM